MLLLLFLTSTVFSGTNADISFPLDPNDDENVKYWEFGGKALVLDKYVDLLPPLQFVKSYAWTNIEISLQKWSVFYEMNIMRGNYGGGFAFWFINKYGANGDLHGGPSNFNGVGVLFSIKEKNSTNQNLNHKQNNEKNVNNNYDDRTGFFEIHILQSSGKDNFKLTTLPNPDKTVSFNFSRFQRILIDFSPLGIQLYLNDELLVQKKLEANIANCYIGATASNYQRVSHLVLSKVKFNIDETYPAEIFRKHNKKINKKEYSSKFKPTYSLRLRNPSFNLTSQELVKREAIFEQINTKSITEVIGNMPNNGTFDDLLDIADECNFASNDMASFSYVNRFISDKLINYSLKWQKRTLKIVDRIQTARNVTGTAWKLLNDVMNTFNTTITQTIDKSNIKIFDLKEILSEMGEKGIDEDGQLQNIVENVSEKKYWKLIQYCMIIETILVIVFFIAHYFDVFSHDY
ncbi:Legume-like lectin family protein [Tritrichomonas foetus]|uniref:Legume-like lectin family protein n=1 Tax=Tritrichomonas foetus TaxID=1144522 RepID=A0A1J4JLP3_9EUKA|nr:Legume-like lectin family protein [Tritrichomonas foetus]|eukprot:OHT00033.1 Legume-like lectin family protein [Tritrichomonas foetus]